MNIHKSFKKVQHAHFRRVPENNLKPPSLEGGMYINLSMVIFQFSQDMDGF